MPIEKTDHNKDKMRNDINDIKEDINAEKELLEKIKQNISDLEKRKQKQIALLLNYLSIGIAITVGITTIFFTGDFLNSSETKQIFGLDTTVINEKINVLEKSLDILTKKINTAYFQNKDNILPTNVNYLEITHIKSEMTDIKNSIENLNKIILDNPEKAISLPLLKQQLANQNEQNDKEFKYTKDEIARVYDINKWIIGLVFGMLVSIIVLNISNLISKNKKE
ncbi:MAG: hypothetical protein JWO09_2675 [Bacteroidetes bacterium]|nr:hypothetical protein [Bacteroidota bacterium]